MRITSLDFDQNGYTVITYCASSLPSSLLEASEVIIVTCQSNPAELEALRRHCARCKTVDVTRWSMLGHLKLGQAVALPLTEESGGELRLFTGRASPDPARQTSREVRGRAREPAAGLRLRQEWSTHGAPLTNAASVRGRAGAHIRRHARRVPRSRRLLRWIDGVFGDHTLAEELRRLEERHRTASRTDTLAEIVAAIRARYDLADGEVAADVH